jgi:hypothetical protein
MWNLRSYLIEVENGMMAPGGQGELEEWKG